MYFKVRLSLMEWIDVKLGHCGGLKTYDKDVRLSAAIKMQ